jgi:hypothetical protein
MLAHLLDVVARTKRGRSVLRAVADRRIARDLIDDVVARELDSVSTPIEPTPDPPDLPPAAVVEQLLRLLLVAESEFDAPDGILEAARDARAVAEEFAINLPRLVERR